MDEEKAMDNKIKGDNEPQVIFEFEFVDPQQEKIEQYSCCDLCGSEFEFNHVTNFVNRQVEEQKECPSCEIKFNKQLHVLQ